MNAASVLSRVRQSVSLARRALQVLSGQGLTVLGVKMLNRWRRMDYQAVFLAGQKQLEDAARARSLTGVGSVSDAVAGGQTNRPNQAAQPLVFSIIVPLFNTQPDHLTAMIASVQAQEYPLWQLCLADGSNQDHVETIVARLAAQDSRIVYQRLAQNLGISGNTNAALALATGDYIALLDHDDLLAPQALAEMHQAIQREGADLLYSDEMNFSSAIDPVKIDRAAIGRAEIDRAEIGKAEIGLVSLIHFKPDFAPDNLLSNNYICHLTVFSRHLAETVGAFDPLCDGSQDYDYILRLSEHAQKIVHIPKVLYYWRIHDGSVASDISVKPYCLNAARLALANHLQRTGRTGQVVNNTILSTYQTHFPFESDLNALVFVTIRHRRELANLHRFALYPAGLAARWHFLIPKDLLPNAKDLGKHSEQFQAQLQAQLDATGLLASIEIVPAGDSLAAHINTQVQSSGEKVLVFLSGQVQSLSINWLNELARHALRPEIGLACGKITRRGLVCQAGLATGIAGSLAGYHQGRADGEPGYMARLTFVNNISAAEQTLMAVATEHFTACGGFDAAFQRDYFDLDLAFRLRAKGFWHVFTPFAAAEVRTSRQLTVERWNRQTGLGSDAALLRERWQKVIAAPDPFYNPNFSQQHARFDQR